MDQSKLHDWQQTIDKIDAGGIQPELLPIAPSDDAPIGSFYREGNYLWRRVLVKYGRGRWGYWINQSESTCCADDIFNGDAAHFAGLLVRSHVSPVESTEWLMVEPRVRPTIPRPPNIEDIERREGRYEYNDVNRIQKGVPDPASRE